MDVPGPTPDKTTVTPPMIRAGILLLIALAHLPLLRFGFVLDDGWTIVSNGFLRYPAHLPRLWEGQAAALGIPDPFRPTLIAFDSVAYEMVGLHARAHHLMSLLLHLCVCVLVDACIARRGAPHVVRYATLATFGMLGIHAEAVAVISFREDLLAAALGLAAVCLATPPTLTSSRTHAPRRSGAAVAALACMTAATATKLSAAPLPVFAWLWWTWPRWRPAARLTVRARWTALLALGVALGVLVRWRMSGQLLPYDPTDPRLTESASAPLDLWAKGVVITTKVFAQTVLPLGLSPEYTPAPRSFASPQMIAWAASLVALVLGAIVLRWRRPALIIPAMLLAWLILWLPTSNVLALPNPRADRYAYLPSVPVCIALGSLFEVALARTRHQTTCLVAGVAFVVLHGSLGMTASRAYVSNSTLWRVASERAPSSARAQAMHGIMMLSRLDRRPVPDPDLLAATEDACRRGLALNPEDAHPHLCFARLRTVQKSWTEAYDHLGRALERAPVRRDAIEAAQLELLPDVMFGQSPASLRGAVLARARTLVERYPYSPTVFEAVGRVLHRLGLPYQAGMAYRAASRRRPERAVTVARRVELAVDRGDLAGAQTLLLQRDMLRGQIDESERTALIARMRLLGRLHDVSLVQSPPPDSASIFP